MKKKNNKPAKIANMSLGQYSAMRLCEILGQKDYKGSSAFIVNKENISFVRGL